MTEITTFDSSVAWEPTCSSCGKEIFSICHATLRIGTEKPIFLHAVCYERLKDEWMDK